MIKDRKEAVLINADGWQQPKSNKHNRDKKQKRHKPASWPMLGRCLAHWESLSQ